MTGRARRPSNALLGVLLAGALAAGCASAPPREPIPTDVLGARALVEERWQHFGDLRTLAAITIRRGTRQDRLNGVLLLQGPRRGPAALRFEALSPFGPPILIVGGTPDGVTVWEVARNRAFLLPASADANRRWLGLSLGVEDLVALLAGHVRPLAEPLGGRRREPDEHGASIELRGPDGTQRFWLDEATGRLSRLEWAQGKSPFRATFEWATKDGPPAAVELVTLDGQLEVRVRYQRPRMDSGFEAALLAVSVPKGVEIQDFR